MLGMETEDGFWELNLNLNKLSYHLLISSRPTNMEAFLKVLFFFFCLMSTY